MRRGRLLAFAFVVLTGCGGGGGDDDDDDDDAPDAGPVTSCDPFGRYGAPGTTFTLPAPGDDRINHVDIQADFPEVDWATLDRLYIPAGAYRTFEIGNLPDRDASRPLVITNLGGQVRIGPNLGGNFIWSIHGGSNWVLTGRYDPDSGTGDEAFAGHRCGAYANSRGTYGFLSDDALDTTGPYLHMGLAVGDATDFEIEYIEVTRSGFAGIRLLNARAEGDPAQPMANVRVHDTYVHDVASEGFYFGWTGAPPSNLFPGLQVYNNRIVRTGSETLQIQDLGDGTRIYNNTLAYGGLHWLDAFGPYQDGNNQIHTREGDIEIARNVVIGGAGTLLSFFSAPEAADGDGDRHVRFVDNHYADVRSLTAYLNGNSAATSSFTFERNTFRGMDFSYTGVDPDATEPTIVFGINAANLAAIAFTDNVWDSPRQLTYQLDVDGTSGNVTATGNQRGAVAPIAFVDSGLPDVPTARLSIWGPTATLAPGMPAIAYATGDLVMHLGELYRATGPSSGLVPPDHPEVWEHLPPPADDVRTADDSPYVELGVR